MTPNHRQTIMAPQIELHRAPHDVRRSSHFGTGHKIRDKPTTLKLCNPRFQTNSQTKNFAQLGARCTRYLLQ